MDPRQKGDDRLVAVFKYVAQKNDAKSAEAGRPIFDDKEVVEIRSPASRDVSVFPAVGFSHWWGDIYGGDQVSVTYAERFTVQYKQFKQQQAQTISGTPLSSVPFLTEGRKAEMRALSIYTVEQLAGIEGTELKNMGPGGRELKNLAMEYMADTKASAPNLQLASELEQMKARNAILEEDFKAMKAAVDARAESANSEYDNMTTDQLREMIVTNTGHEPHGVKNMNRKTLVRLVQQSQPKAA